MSDWIDYQDSNIVRRNTSELDNTPLKNYLDTTYVSASTGIVDPYEDFKTKLREDPANAKIVLLGDSTSLEANYPGTFTTLRDFNIVGGPLEGMQDANVISGGSNGATTAVFTNGTAAYGLDELVADNPDLVVVSYGLNDVRVNGSESVLVENLQLLISQVKEALPNASILMRMPNSILTVGGYLVGTTAQEATDKLFNAYHEVIAADPTVGFIDAQSEIFGRISGDSSVLMTDQLHPNSDGQALVAKRIAEEVGITDSNLWFSGLGPSKTIIPSSVRHLLHISAAGNGYFDIGAVAGLGYGVGTELPLQNGDVIYVEDYGTITLSGAVFANTAGFNLRVLMSGDWSAVQNSRASFVCNRPMGIQRGRFWVSDVNLPSVAAGASQTQTFTISGLNTENGILAQPPTSFSSFDLIWSAYISATDTVTVRYFNPTGSPIDPPTGNWKFWAAY